ncbi:MAG TPA: hypothetical protein PLI51_07920 [bacterium]|nr:hypothetical protein [bacterium]HPQ66635.1 hypothetical protein [bacterium]
MKLFSRRLWGNVLIVAGVALFLAVAYDTVRPFFPRGPAGGAAAWVKSLFSSAGRDSREAPDRAAPRPRKPPTMPREMAEKGLMTGNIHNTQGNYVLWVWRVKPEKKTGSTVTVRIAHALEGEDGGFHIVAFADRNGDNKPDREIARSEFLTAKETGDWSEFSFSSEDAVIFVGCTWPGGRNTHVYRGSGGWPGEDPVFDDRFFHEINRMEAKDAGPAYTNMKISFSD